MTTSCPATARVGAWTVSRSGPGPAAPAVGRDAGSATRGCSPSVAIAAITAAATPASRTATARTRRLDHQDHLDEPRPAVGGAGMAVDTTTSGVVTTAPLSCRADMAPPLRARVRGPTVRPGAVGETGRSG